MRASWHALHAQLLRHVERLAARTDFNHMQTHHPELAMFPDIPALLEHQHARAGDPEPKNRTLRALVAAAQGDDPHAETAQVLVLLALWPGLDALYGQLRRYVPRDPDWLGSELSARMTEAIARIDLDRVDRVAATLLMNVRRDILRDLKRCWARDEVPLPDDLQAPEPVPSCDTALGHLRQLIGEDAALVVAVVVMGFSQREAAQALGLSHDATRKRYQRALERLRALDGKSS